MKKNILRKLVMLLVLPMLFATTLSGCGESDTDTGNDQDSVSPPSSSNEPSQDSSDDSVPATQLYVTFGDDGSPFTMHLYDNDTAATIANHVGTADWRLPIYNFDDYDNWEVMQFYDIPSRYEIPSNPESVTTEQSGQVYYSEPNRIVLFFGDAQVSGEYTPVGYFDATDDFVSAVQNNPTLEGWGNKIIKISAEE